MKVARPNAAYSLLSIGMKTTLLDRGELRDLSLHLLWGTQQAVQ